MPDVYLPFQTNLNRQYKDTLSKTSGIPALHKYDSVRDLVSDLSIPYVKADRIINFPHTADLKIMQEFNKSMLDKDMQQFALDELTENKNPIALPYWKGGFFTYSQMKGRNMQILRKGRKKKVKEPIEVVAAEETNLAGKCPDIAIIDEAVNFIEPEAQQVVVKEVQQEVELQEITQETIGIELQTETVQETADVTQEIIEIQQGQAETQTETAQEVETEPEIQTIACEQQELTVEESIEMISEQLDASLLHLAADKIEETIKYEPEIEPVSQEEMQQLQEIIIRQIQPEKRAMRCGAHSPERYIVDKIARMKL